jgi:hypothetical protein
MRITPYAAIAVTTVALAVPPAAHAAADCTAPGGALTLSASGGYDVTVDAAGSTLGPHAVVRTPDGSSDWNVLEGGITGRSVVFNIGPGSTKAYAHFEGAVGPDGYAHGTASGLASPVSLPAGTWDSTGPLTCQ